jgi:hypothetical protein
MAYSLTNTSPPSTPDVLRGEIYQNAGKYARGAVLFAFEQIGGPQGLADWAADKPDDFYTKLFPKIIAKEVEVNDRRGVDELLDALDGEYQVVQDGDVVLPDYATAITRDFPAGELTVTQGAPAGLFQQPPQPPQPVERDFVPWEMSVDDLVDFVDD